MATQISGFKLSGLLLGIFFLCISDIQGQALSLPEGGVNHKSWAGRRIGVTDIEIQWNAPGVKGREGQIWGTPVAYYGFSVLGFGSDAESPWRAGANENTTLSFSTDVTIEGKKLAAGKYGFFIALYPDSCTLIFSKNNEAWGSYFYKPEHNVLAVSVRQQKNLPQSREWLEYTFSNQNDHSVVIALEWEHWRIPFTVAVDLKETVLASIQGQMSGGAGFDPPSLQAAARWCLNNQVNLDEALNWINRATDPRLGGVSSFAALSTKAELLRLKGNPAEAETAMQTALTNATVFEMHGYGRQLIAQKKYEEALAVFEQNFKKHGDTWPTHVGLARGYSATGDLKKALKHAKTALTQAPDDLNRNSLEAIIKTLEEGKALVQ
ncbi:MAG: DUF2911 domain-containing protein [Bacteroidia bacterium]|nr:DUF2911 domain-containing protein [Bacteroidia bacterium]